MGVAVERRVRAVLDQIEEAYQSLSEETYAVRRDGGSMSPRIHFVLDDGNEVHREVTVSLFDHRGNDEESEEARLYDNEIEALPDGDPESLHDYSVQVEIATGYEDPGGVTNVDSRIVARVDDAADDAGILAALRQAYDSVQEE